MSTKIPPGYARLKTVGDGEPFRNSKYSKTTYTVNSKKGKVVSCNSMASGRTFDKDGNTLVYVAGYESFKWPSPKSKT